MDIPTSVGAGRLTDGLGSETEYMQRAMDEHAPPRDRALAFRHLGDLYKSAGDSYRALQNYLNAVRHDRSDAEAFFNLGILLHSVGNCENAVVALRTAHQLAPDNPAVIANLGIALSDMGQTVPAEALLRLAVRLVPDETASIRNLATLLRDKGDAAGALEMWERLIQIRPFDAEAHYNRINAPGFNVTDADIAEMNALFESAAGVDDKALLGFALFRGLERCGRTAEAFEWLTLANHVKRGSYLYDPAPEADVFVQIRNHFGKLYFAKPYFNTLSRSANKAPIFITGMPRSGTSLAEQILASHSDIHGAGELDHITDLIGKYLTTTGRRGLDLDHFSPDSPIAQAMADDYRAKIANLANGKPYITDKMPLNFRWIGIIKSMFPDAKIIHCTRPPIETCMSIYASLFGSKGNQYAYDLEELGYYYVQYAQLMDHWHTVLGNDILHFDLDALKSDQEGESRKLLAFCDLSWEAQCLEFNKTARSVKTLSAGRVHKPLDRTPDKRTAHFRTNLKPLEAILTNAGIDPENHWRKNDRNLTPTQTPSSPARPYSPALTAGAWRR